MNHHHHHPMNHHPEQLQLLPVIRVRSERFTDAQRAHLSRTLKLRGIRPRLRWGWGSPMPAPQALLLRQLREQELQVEPERVLRVRGHRQGQWPLFHKLDLWLPQLATVIEVDGHAHRAIVRQERDARREHDLMSRSLSTIRATNELVLQFPQVVVRLVEMVATAREQDRGSWPGVHRLRLRRGQPEQRCTGAPVTLRPDQQGRVQVYGPGADGDRLQLELPLAG